MLTKFEKIKNIGNFEDYNAFGDVSLHKVNIIYAENGAGKTTLARILQSLSKNDPSIIERHKRIGSTSVSEVQVKEDNGASLIFNGNRWNRSLPEIEVFDAHFVADNIYTGFEINTTHHKKLYQFVVGEAGVAIIKKIERIKRLLEKVNIEISQNEDNIKAKANHLNVAEVCQLQQITDIDNLIAEKEKELGMAKSQEQILKLKIPDIFKLRKINLDIKNINAILNFSISDIGQEYVEMVKARLEVLKKNGMKDASSWLHIGTQTISKGQDDICPFCGQALNDVQLIAGYNQYFSKRYTDAQNEATNLKERINQINIEAFLLEIDSQYKQMETDLNYWRVYKSDLPQLPALNLVDYNLKCRFDNLLALVNQKVSNPIVSLPTEISTEFDNSLQSILAKCKELDDFVRNSQTTIKDLQTNIRPVEDVAKELKILQLNKTRFQEPLKKMCNLHTILLSQSNRLNALNKTLQQQQKEESNLLFKQYGTKINFYLQNVFCTKFKIENVQDGGFKGRSKEPNLDYTLTFDGTLIEQGDDENANTSFRNVLSEGDKNTIAFSFFLAKLALSFNLSDIIVVFDDPLTSLDLNRRNATIDQLIVLISLSKQLIVLSHNLHFLIDFNARKEIKKAEKKVLQIVNANGKSRIIDYNIKKDWIDNYKKSINTMIDFVDNPTPEKQELAINSIRLSLETFLKLKYCNYISDQDQTFGQVVGELQRSSCVFINTNKQDVISKLNNLVAISWRTHHGSVEEREIYSEKTLNMTEAINYTKQTLHLLNGEL